MKTKTILSVVSFALAECYFTANAQYFDDFNSGSDANWTRWAPGPAAATFGFPPLAPSNLGYELAAAPGTASFFTTARAGSYVTGLSVSDFIVSADLVTWAPTNEIQQGVMARENNAQHSPPPRCAQRVARFA